MRPPTDSLEKRLARLRSYAEEEKACGILLTQAGNVAWATGLRTGSLLALENAVYLLVPPLEYYRVSRRLEELGLKSLELVVYQPYRLPEELELGGSPRTVKARLGEAVKTLIGRGGCKLLVDGLPADLYAELGRDYSLEPARRVTEMRMVKEPWEIEAMERAAWVAEKAVARALAELRPGVSEAEVAAAIEYEMRRLGAEDHAFPPIVAFNENTVYPHAEPSDRRRLAPGSVVLLDVGARVDGYCSDMTRTLCLGGCPAEARKLIEAVEEAFSEALEAARPGARAEEVDAAARRALERHGLSKYFVHSLGHGIGVEVHEAPRLSPGSNTELRDGMVFTVEPGVYVPGRSIGVRVEDTVAIVNGRPRRLTRLPHDLTWG